MDLLCLLKLVLTSMISIVIPIYNEEENLNLLRDRIFKASESWGDSFELILVDDGSFDNSLTIMTDFAKGDEQIKVVKLSRNFGHQAAISAGMKISTGDVVVVMDGDLQDPPEELPRFLKKWKEGYQVIYAIRKNRKEFFFKKIAYKLFYRLLSMISDIDIPLDSGDFCVMDRKVVDVLNIQMIEQNRFVRGLRAYAGFRQIGVEYDRAERAAGEVKYTFKKLVKLALDGIFDFSTFPLRIATYFGFFVSMLSFVAGIFFIIHRIIDFKILGYSPADVPGVASIAVAVFFLSGVILVVLGIIGEYIGRIYFEVKKRPFYIIEDIIGQPHNE